MLFAVVYGAGKALKWTLKVLEKCLNLTLEKV